MADQIGPKLRCSCPPGDDAQASQVVRHLAPRSRGEMVAGLSANAKLSSFRRKINLHTALPSLGSASGGVGGAAAQIGKWRGARVIGSTGRSSGRTRQRQLRLTNSLV